MSHHIQVETTRAAPSSDVENGLDVEVAITLPDGSILEGEVTLVPETNDPSYL